MCGIFGIIIKKSAVTATTLQEATDTLLLLSQSRGKESSGIMLRTNNSIAVYKEPVEASRFIREKTYQDMLHDAYTQSADSLAVVGHARLVTNGDESYNYNNQPVVRDGIVGVHNGIIVNDQVLWSRHGELLRSYDVDTEILFALVRERMNQGYQLQDSLRSAFNEIQGTASIALFFNDVPVLALATNNGSLYLAEDPGNNFHVFASEKIFLTKFFTRPAFAILPKRVTITQVSSGHGKLINLSQGNIDSFLLEGKDAHVKSAVGLTENKIPIHDLASQHVRSVRNNTPYNPSFFVACEHEFEKNKEEIKRLRRCTKCVLPETMTFITFDEAGVCNYCRTYLKVQHKGEVALRERTDRLRRSDGRPDCLAAFSGGRDSSYGLHYLVKELGLHPITYTYDWGIITDLARRNQARLCGKLGLEHILVSADIRKKRNNIKKNIEAWFRQPDLGLVPLFMAGDKQFFYYANQLQKQTQVPTIFFSFNPLEKTEFKTGFCGIPPTIEENTGNKTYRISLGRYLKMAQYYLKHFVVNPSYINNSLFDTTAAYVSYYMIPHNYTYFYDYIPWDEKTIEDTLMNEYDWELAPDSTSTWRIGDGTAAFYNFIYYTVAGFTENDTFRSNQIREGMITREEGMRLVERDNRPRFDSIRWYGDTIGIDHEHAVKIIQNMPKLYPMY